MNITLAKPVARGYIRDSQQEEDEMIKFSPGFQSIVHVGTDRYLANLAKQYSGCKMITLRLWSDGKRSVRFVA